MHTPSPIIICGCIYIYSCFSLVQPHTPMHLPPTPLHVAVFTYIAALVWFSPTPSCPPPTSLHVAVFTYIAALVWFSHTHPCPPPHIIACGCIYTHSCFSLVQPHTLMPRPIITCGCIYIHSCCRDMQPASGTCQTSLSAELHIDGYLNASRALLNPLLTVHMPLSTHVKM